VRKRAAERAGVTRRRRPTQRQGARPGFQKPLQGPARSVPDLDTFQRPEPRSSRRAGGETKERITVGCRHTGLPPRSLRSRLPSDLSAYRNHPATASALPLRRGGKTCQGQRIVAGQRGWRIGIPDRTGSIGRPAHKKTPAEASAEVQFQGNRHKGWISPAGWSWRAVAEQPWPGPEGPEPGPE
jgi:hypothetical protein